MIWLCATQVPDPSLGVLASLLAVVLVWTHRSRFVPFWMPAEAWHELERREGKRITVIGPVEEAAPAAVAPPEIPVGDDFQGALLEMQGQFEAAMQKFTAAAESEWHDLEHQLIELHTRYQVVRGQLAEYLQGKEALLDQAAERGQALTVRAWLEPERAVPEVSLAPVEPPVELTGTGWSEPDEKGLRTRSDGHYFEYLGAPAETNQQRPYYREARPPGFVEIARGVVAGKQLLITDCSRFPEKPELAGEPVAIDPGAILQGMSRAEAEALEKALWALPGKFDDFRFGFADDLGGRVDWAGKYRSDEDGFPLSYAALRRGHEVLLRADLAGRPRMLARALRAVLDIDKTGFQSGDHAAWRWVEL